MVTCPACLGSGRMASNAVVVHLCWLCVGRKVVPDELADRHRAGAAVLAEQLARERGERLEVVPASDAPPPQREVAEVPPPPPSRFYMWRPPADEKSLVPGEVVTPIRRGFTMTELLEHIRGRRLPDDDDPEAAG